MEEPSEWGRLWAICCTSELRRQDVQKFLEEMYNTMPGSGRGMPNPNPKMFVVIEDPDEEYDEGTVFFGGPDPFRSPFVGQSLLQVAESVYEHKKRTQSDLNLECCVVLDGQGVNDKTAWVVSMVRSDDGVPDTQSDLVVKADWRSVSSIILSIVGGVDFDDYVQIAKRSEDGVYHWRH